MANPNLNSDPSFLKSADREFENSIRPAVLDEFSGQSQIIENISIFIKAAKMRGEALDHILFHGPPGLGKTTLSRIVAAHGDSFRIRVDTSRNRLPFDRSASK